MSENSTIISTFGTSYREVAVGNIAMVAAEKPLKLECGMEIASFPVAYQTYGRLNAEKSNAILVCHGLTGDQYAASPHPVTGKPGWWESIIGPGKPLDTERFFIVASNVIGGCMGSFGPKSINPVTGKPYGLDFPVLTINDMVRAQALLLDYLGIAQLFCVIGGSMGGMLTLAWTALYPERVFSAIPIATSARHSAQNIAFHEIGRQAIMVDPDWCEGRYYDEKKIPEKGLGVARMAAHVTYLSDNALHRKFGRTLQDREQVSYGFEADFQVESYLRHQGAAFVERFDANSYFYITRAMDYFDLTQNGGLTQCFKGTKIRFLVISFTSDWLFPSSESRNLVRALNAVAANVSFADITTDKGHDAFLLDEPEFFASVGGFINGSAKVRGI
ncbi:MAG TPA: homoserine O-acetyltransferase [Rickettsiales bacterium]|nr:homoserine O-acetyltransferase [Rickettsiales bacterium]